MVMMKIMNMSSTGDKMKLRIKDEEENEKIIEISIWQTLKAYILTYLLFLFILFGLVFFVSFIIELFW